MEQYEQHIQDLLEQHLRGELTPAGREAFFAAISADDTLLSRLAERLPAGFSGSRPLDETSKATILATILNADGQESMDRRESSAPVHRLHLLRTAWVRYAAVIILAAGVGGGIWWYASGVSTRLRSVDPSTPLRALAEVQPGRDRAILTLADGSTIILDSATNGNLTNQGSVQIIKLTNGQLAYQAGTSKGALSGVEGSTERSRVDASVTYNTITTPRGGQYQIVLPDGTRVWLNAASSLKFPTTPSAPERKLTLTGEAYFEVANDKSKPFYVNANGTEVSVLGTSFNINAYTDQQVVKTTLLEGAVKINNSILKPGEAYENGKIISTNIDQDIAWKNGVFNFQDLNVEDAMRQLARWYDLEIVYEGNVANKVFGGRMGRGLTLSQVLRGLNGVGVHLKLEGRVLHVSP